VAIQLTNAGNDKILKNLLGVSSTTEPLILKLFENNATPSLVSDNSTFNEVVDDPGGYEAVELTSTIWTIAGGIATTSPLIFTFQTFIGSVFGYYLVGKDSGEVIAAESFNTGAFRIANPGDSITITVSMSLN